MCFRNLFLALLLISSTPAFAAKRPVQCWMVASGEEPSEAESANEFLRDQPRHFFTDSEALADWMRTSPYAYMIGFIHGDGHVGNMNRDFVNGQPRWMALDLDDLGFGPLLAGLAKTMVDAKSGTKEIKYWDMTEVYFKGLSGVYMKPPKKVEKQLALEEEEYLDAMEEYADEKSEDDQIINRGDYVKMNAHERKIIIDAVNATKGFKYTHGMRMIKEDGGSADARRYRVLGVVNGRRAIIDIKQAMSGNLFAGIGSQDPETHLKMIMPTIFDNDLKYRALLKLDVVGKGQSLVYVMRPKVEVKVLVKQPPKDKELDLFIELNLYNIYQQGRDAYLYALKHGNDKELARFVRLYNENPELMSEDVKELCKEYLDEVARLRK